MGVGRMFDQIRHTALMLEALRFAAEQHRDQRRKGAMGAPYINHPIAVAAQLAAEGLGDSTELMLAALLHDVVEDTGATAPQLVERFGPIVACLVLEVTDDKALPRAERKQRRVATIGACSHAARLIKLSDMISNIHDMIYDPPDWDRARKLDYLAWADACLTAVRGTHPGLERRLDLLIGEGRARLAGG